MLQQKLHLPGFFFLIWLFIIALCWSVTNCHVSNCQCWESSRKYSTYEFNLDTCSDSNLFKNQIAPKNIYNKNLFWCSMQISVEYLRLFLLYTFVCTVLCCANLLQFCPTVCNPMVCSPPGFSVHSILQTRIIKQVAVPSSSYKHLLLHNQLMLFPQFIEKISGNNSWDNHCKNLPKTTQKSFLSVSIWLYNATT